MLGYQRLKFPVVFIVPIILYCLTGSGRLFADSFEEANTLFQRSMEGREKIKSGQMILKSKYQGREGGKTRPNSYSMEITFADDRFFIRKKDGSRTNYYCSNCDVPDSFVFVNLQPVLHANLNHPTFEKHGTALPDRAYPDALMFFQENDVYQKTNLDIASRMKKQIDTRDYSIPSFQYIGVIPENSFSPQPNLLRNLAGIFESRSKEESGGLPSIKIQPVADEYVGDDLCKKISWSVTSELRIKGKTLALDQPIVVESQRNFWLDPSKDHIVRKAVLTVGTWENSLINEVSQEPKSKIWYPSHWVYELRDRGQVLEHEECDLEAISLNTSQPSHVFSCRNVEELEPGTLVRWHMDAPPPAEGRLVWDGKKVVGLGEYKFGIATAPRDTARRNFVIFVNVAGLSAIAAVLFFRAWRKRRNA